MPRGLLPRQDTELVIIHVAVRRGCEYERNHHARIGRSVGLTRDQVDHAGDITWPEWMPGQRVLLDAADQILDDQILDDRVLDDACWSAVGDLLERPQCIETTDAHRPVLTGQHLMSLRVQPEG